MKFEVNTYEIAILQQLSLLHDSYLSKKKLITYIPPGNFGNFFFNFLFWRGSIYPTIWKGLTMQKAEQINIKKCDSTCEKFDWSALIYNYLNSINI